MAHVTVEHSAVGFRVLVEGDMEVEEILAALPPGWTIHPDDFNNGVKTRTGAWSYPLSREECP